MFNGCPQEFSLAEGDSDGFFGVDLGLSTSEGGCDSDPAVDSAKLSASSQFVFPLLSTPEVLSLVSLDASHRS